MTDSWGRTFEADILARAAEDWVDPLELLNSAGDQGVMGGMLRMYASLGVLSSLVTRGLAILGNFGGGQGAWDLAPAEAVERVTRAWAARDDPYGVTFGEIFWLAVTDDGRALGHAVWAREETSGVRDLDDDEDDGLVPLQPVETTNAQGRTLEEDVLARAARQSVAPSELLGSAADQGVVDPGMRRYVAIGLLSSLVTRGLSTLGDAAAADDSPDNIRPWDLSPAESVARMTREWMVLDDPDNEAADVLFRVAARPTGGVAARGVLAREDGPGGRASVDAGRTGREALDEVLAGDARALPRLTVDSLDSVRRAVGDVGLVVRAEAVSLVLRDLRDGRVSAATAQAWASFVRRGYWTPAAGTGVRPLEISYDPSCEDAIADAIGRFDELGDAIDGSISRSEIGELLKSLASVV